MSSEPIWFTGSTRSGKTAHLVSQFCAWVQAGAGNVHESGGALPSAIAHGSNRRVLVKPGILVLAAIGDNRLELVDRLTQATHGEYPFDSSTPLGFFEREVMLFYPLLVETLNLKAPFPLRLAPENEQELATQLWRVELDRAVAQASSPPETRLVRRVLDLLQLAALAGMPLEDIPTILEQGLAGQRDMLLIPAHTVGELLQRWQTWCLDRGLLTYGIIAGLYWQYLLPNPTYQHHLAQRYAFVLADDVDEYPAIARHLFEVLLNRGAIAAFTYNPDGAVRLGLGADPDYLAELAARCRIETLTERPIPSLSDTVGTEVVALVTEPIFFASLPESIQTLQTTSRAQLLHRTAEVIVEAVRAKKIQPREIAVIAPGLDAIARYTLIDHLTRAQIPVEPLNDQRPLTSFPLIRALLTLLTLVYPGLGRLVDREAVAEMLVVLSGQPSPQETQSPTVTTTQSPVPSSPPHPPISPSPHPTSSLNPSPFTPSSFGIDPVRAGLLADYCFAPHPDRPRLLPTNVFPRWDRLGYRTTNLYQDILQWVETQQSQLEQRLIPNAVTLLDRAIQHFFLGGRSLPFDQVAALRQLLEAAQHYWEVHSRLRRGERSETPASMTVSRFIQLLRSGAVTANPYPIRPVGPASNAVTLATVFQYRSSRRAHRWQFWLDAGSPRWLSGIDALFAAPLFTHGWSGRPWTATDTLNANDSRLRRILLDLLGRTSERVYLCHSDLSTSGQEQTGILLSLIDATAAHVEKSYGVN